MHTPVLLQEVLQALDPKPGEFMIDGTLGAGGHARELIKRVGKFGMFLGTDWDPDAVLHFKVPESGEVQRVIVRNASYTAIPEILKDEELPKADGLLLDLGFSSTQVEDAKRGFSFLHDGPLDMRYTTGGISAAEVVNSYRENELADILYQYGDERFSRQIAKRIVEERRTARIMTTRRLADIVVTATPARFRHGRIHAATKTFQALRIYVNHEFENIESILNSLDGVLKPGGRVAVITFHSLEDTIVKKKFQELAKEGKAELLMKKPLAPTDEEVEKNPRSRSAKLRALRWMPQEVPAPHTEHQHYL